MADKSNLSVHNSPVESESAPSKPVNDADREYRVRLFGWGTEMTFSGFRDRRIWDIALLQSGRVSRRQLTEVGISASAITRRVRRGYLIPEHPGVYALEYLTDVPLGRAAGALLALREGAVLSHGSAAEIWGLRPAGSGDGLVHVTIVGGWTGRRKGVRIHRCSSLDRQDIRIRRGLRLTSPARTLLDLATVLPDRQLELALDQSLVLGVARLPEIVEITSRAQRHRGRRRLKQLLERESGPTLTRSEAEERLLGLVRKAALPDPRVNARLHGYEVDFHWPFEDFVVEVDGFRYHSSRRAFEHDRRKDATLQAAGLTTMRVTWRQIENEPYIVVAHLAQALAQAEAKKLARETARAPTDEELAAR